MPVEKTSKPLKLAQLLTLGTAIGSAGYAFYHQTPEGLQMAGIGGAVGIGGYLFVRILGWWLYG